MLNNRNLQWPVL